MRIGSVVGSSAVRPGAVPLALRWGRHSGGDLPVVGEVRSGCAEEAESIS